MKKIIVVAHLFAAAIGSVSAQDASDEVMYQAYIRQDKALWKKAIDTRAMELKQAPTKSWRQSEGSCPLRKSNSGRDIV